MTRQDWRDIVAKRIVDRMKKLGYSRQRVLDGSGISYHAFHGYLHARTTMPADVAVNIANALYMTVDELIGVDDIIA